MKIFYDLGTHLFGGLKEFNEMYHFDPSWKIFCFEANPYTYELAKQKVQEDEWLRSLNIEFTNAVVSDKNGITNVDCYYDNNEQNYTDVGSNSFNLKNDYFKGVWPEMYDKMGDNYCNVKEVPSINFSEFIDKNTSYGDEVIVKMDIEGSEFPVLTQMIQNNTHTLVKTIYIEWHERFWPNEQDKYLAWKNAIITELQKDNIDAKIWW